MVYCAVNTVAKHFGKPDEYRAHCPVKGQKDINAYNIVNALMVWWKSTLSSVGIKKKKSHNYDIMRL